MEPDEEFVRQLIAAGATQDEIFGILDEMLPKEVAPKKRSVPLLGASVLPDATQRPMQDIAGEALDNVKNVGKAFASGVGSSLKRTAGLAASSVSGLPVATGLFAATGKDLTKLRKAEPEKIDETRKTASIEKLAQGAGQIAGSLPLYAGVSAGVRAGGAALASRVVDPTLKAFLTRSVPGSFWKSAAVSAPANVVEGVVADAALYPEQMRTPENILRSAALSLGGTIFDGFAGAKTIGTAIKEAETPEQVKKVVELLTETKEAPAPFSTVLPTKEQAANFRANALLNDPNVPVGVQLPTAEQAAKTRMEAVVQKLTDEKLAEIAANNLKRESLANKPGKTSILTARGNVRSLVASPTEPEDVLVAAQMQGAIERASAKISVLKAARQGSGRAIDNLSFVEADVSNSLLTFEELSDLARMIQVDPSLRDIGPDNLLRTKRSKGSLNKHQKFLIEVQDKLNAAAKEGFSNMSVPRLLDLEDDLLKLSNRLSEGFDSAPKKFIGDILDPKTQKPAKSSGNIIIEEPEVNLPKPKRIGVDESPIRVGQTLDEIRAADDADFVKRIAASDLPPRVKITPSKTVADRVIEEPTGYAKALQETNIEYGKSEPTGPQITMRQRLQDRNIPIKDISPQGYAMLNNLGAARLAADQATRRRGGLLLPKLEDTGIWRGATEVVDAMPLYEIQREAGDNLVDLEALLKAIRTLDDPKIKTGMSLENAQVIVDRWKADSKMMMLVGEYKKNTDFMAEYLGRLGRATPEKVEALKKQMYAPMGRIFNQRNRGNSFLARLGSERKSAPIFEQTIEQMYSVIEKSQKNYAWHRILEDLKKDPIKMRDHISLIGEVSPRIFDAEIKDMVDAGIPQKEAWEWVQANFSGTLDETDGSLIIFSNGIGSKYQVSAPLALAAKSASPMELNLAQEIMMGISTPMRESVALGLDLSAIGPMSDAVIAAIRDPEFRIVRDMISGAWSAAIKDETYLQSVAAGRGFGGRLRPGDNVFNVKPTKSNPITAGVKTILDLPKYLNNFIRPISEAARVGLYKSQIRQGADPMAAATFANNAIGNWNVIGANIRSWSLITEFGNVGIQSGVVISQAVKAISKDPKLAAKAALVGSIGLTAPTLYLLSAYKDDEELNALRRTDNYDYWYWRDASGEPVRMRKPGWWLTSVFSAPVEAWWDRTEPGTRDRLAKTMMNSIMFNPVPISLQTAMGLMQNDAAILNPLNEIPIVPGAQQDVSPAVQGTLQNSKLAMGVRDAAGISPFKTDYLLRQGLGADLASLVTVVTGGSVGTKDRLPVLGRYSVSPRAQTEGSKLFYNDLNKARQVDRTYREYIYKGDQAGAEKYMQENRAYLGLNNALIPISQKMAQINLLLRMTSADDRLSKETKINVERYYRGIMNQVFAEYYEARKSMLVQLEMQQ